MSLKAKVEAIIYAAEEPITVEQIAQLLRDQILAEEARLYAEAQSAAETKAAEEAQRVAEESSVDAESAGSTEATEAATTEENAPTLSLREEDGVPAEAVTDKADAECPLIGAEAPDVKVDDASEDGTASPCEPGAPNLEASESTEANEASTPLADEAAPAETCSETPTIEAAESTAVVEAAADQNAPEAPAETAAEEPAPAESASVDAPAAPGKRQKKSKEELAVDAKVRARVRALIGELIADYASEERGIEVRQVAGGYRMSTKPEHHDVVRAFAKSLKPPVRLSLAALETLAVIAYKQPITVPEISEIRGVESGGVIATLLDRKLITTAGRKQVIGRPILYKTAKEFLLRFGLNEISELPSMEEFEKLAAEGLGGEEQTSLDLQPQSPEPSDPSQTEAAEAGASQESSGSEATTCSSEEPASEVAETTAAQQEHADEAAGEERHSGAQAEEPQHS